MTGRPTPPPDRIPEAMADAIVAYALEALPPEEAATVAAYVALHPEARALLDEYRAIVGLLPYATVPSEPPAALRAGVLRSIQTKPPRRLPLPRAFRPRVASAIAACLLLGLLVWNVGLQVRVHQYHHHAAVSDTAAAVFGAPGVHAYDMLPEAGAPASSGRIYLTPDQKQAALVVSGLPALPAGRTYQLWFRLEDQTRVSMATFTVDGAGAAVVVVPVPATRVPYVSCGITLEPQGGSRSPTGPRILASQPWPESYT